MITKNVIIVLTLIAIFSVACSSDKIDYKDECIVGIWEISDTESYARALLPPGSFDPKSLQFMRGNQELAYKFDADGTLSILGVDWISSFEFVTNQTPQILDLKINGFASGTYQLDGDVITIGDVLDDRITYQALLDGEDMLSTTHVGDFAVLFVSPYKTARFVCNQEKLSLWLVDYPSFKDAITFSRTE